MPHSRTGPAATVALALLLAASLSAQDGAGVLIPSGASSGLPLVRANDNTAPAGALRDGVREIALEVVRSDWRLETPDGPGLRVAAIREVGGVPVIPAPLLRVEAGTRVRVRVRNTLEETVTVFGLHTRPVAEDAGGFVVQPGSERTVEFDPGVPGTYIYLLLKDGEIVPITLHAKDGADLPRHQLLRVLRLPRLGAGVTADFTWTPTEPGTYELRIGYGREASLSQIWEVTGG